MAVREHGALVFARIVALIIVLYFFICSLDLMSNGFRLVGGRTAGKVLGSSKLLTNPVAGLMIGELATVLLQSSSATTSILVTMVASDLLSVHNAIPIVMGANIGTSMTNTLVSLGQSADRAQFERAFAGAIVHDMFNYLSVICLLPAEAAFGLIERLTALIVANIDGSGQSGSNLKLLTALTDQLTDRIVQVNREKISEVAESEFNHIFAYSTWSDATIGIILLLISIASLVICLVSIVKLLRSMLNGPIAMFIQKTVNRDTSDTCNYFTGYIAILIGCGMTFLVQSSSVLTSAMTPLVGLGVVSLSQMYPLTIGANIGTTFTSLLAALAADPYRIKFTMQLALCHMFFNVIGTLIFYPIPFMRWPIVAAKLLGATTAKYRWFAVVYLIIAFFIAPAAILGLSMAGKMVMTIVLVPVFGGIMFAIIINVMQVRAAKCLPKFLRDWNFLPVWFHSLEPYDQILSTVGQNLMCCSKCRQPTTVSAQISNYDDTDVGLLQRTSTDKLRSCTEISEIS